MRLRRSWGEKISRRFCFSSHRDQEIRGHGVGQLARVLHAHRGEHGVVVQVVRELHVLLELGDHLRHHGFDAAAGLGLAGDELGHHLEEALLLLELEGAAALETLHQHLHVAVGQLQALHDVADGAQGVDLVGAGVVTGGVVLGGQEDPLALHEGVLQRADRAGPADDERDHLVGKHHHVPQGDHGQRLDHVQLVLVAPEDGQKRPPLLESSLNGERLTGKQGRRNERGHDRGAERGKLTWGVSSLVDRGRFGGVRPDRRRASRPSR